jgi:hypothetical protein
VDMCRLLAERPSIWVPGAGTPGLDGQSVATCALEVKERLS